MILNNLLDTKKDEMIKTLQEVLRIPSYQMETKENAPYGEGVANALKYMLDKADEMGFKTCNFDNQVGYAEFGEGELIAIVSHLDVVPAGEGWTTDPFGGEIIDGKVFGRGALDDKGPAVASLYAMQAVKESGLPIKYRIRLMFGTNEETGSGDMKYFFSHGGEQPVMGFTPDADYPLINGEKGILITTVRKNFNQENAEAVLVEIKGGTAFNVVPALAEAKIICKNEIFDALKTLESDRIKVEKTEDGCIVKTEGVGAHGSLPELGINAIGILFDALKDVPFAEDLKETISFLNAKIGMETDGKSLGIAISDEVSGGLVLNIGTMSGDRESLEITFNYRYPVTLSYEDCGPKFNAAFKENGFEIASERHEKAIYTEPDSKLVKTLLKVYKEQTGRDGEAMSIGGGTYAKSVNNTVAFGPCFPDNPGNIHEANESTDIEEFLLNSKIFAHAIYELSK